MAYVALLYTIWDFTDNGKQDEDMFTQILNDYVEYAHLTPRFLPRVWRSR